MTYTQISALLVFAFVSSITPGPNNLMLMVSGANFGLKRTVPHIVGVGFGFVSLVLLVGIGIAQIFTLWPASYVLMKVACAAYMIWLAWKIATSASTPEARRNARPMTFLQAAAFQWVNPKGWAMALTSITAYAPEANFTGALFVALVFGLINIPSVTAWAAFGQQMSGWLKAPRALRRFNWTMAALLLASLYPLLQA